MTHHENQRMIEGDTNTSVVVCSDSEQLQCLCSVGPHMSLLQVKTWTCWTSMTTGREVELGEAKKSERRQEGGSSDKPDVLNLLHHHLLPFLPLSLLQQLLESSQGGVTGQRERRKQEMNRGRRNVGQNGQKKLCANNQPFHPSTPPLCLILFYSSWQIIWWCSIFYQLLSTNTFSGLCVFFDIL